MKKIDKKMGQTIDKIDLKSHYLNVIFVGDNCWQFIPEMKENCINRSYYYDVRHPNFDWNYYLFEGFADTKLILIKTFIMNKCSLPNPKELNNVIICKIDDLIVERLLSLVKALSTITPITIKPRIFIISNHNFTEDQMRELIKKAEIQYDTEDTIKANINNNYLIDLNHYLFNESCFLNQLGDEYVFHSLIANQTYEHKITEKGNNRINLILVGAPGAGKTTFINNTLKEKRGLARQGMPVTKEIIQYKHKSMPIALYDTPGFQSEKDTRKILKTIKNFSEEQKKNNQDPIHLILYFNELQINSFQFVFIVFYF